MMKSGTQNPILARNVVLVSKNQHIWCSTCKVILLRKDIYAVSEIYGYCSVKHWIPNRELQNAWGRFYWLDGSVSRRETSWEAPSRMPQSRSLKRDHMCVLLMTVKQVTEERITWLATFCSIKGKLLNVQSRIAILTSLSKGIWPGMSKDFIMGIPPQLRWKLRSSMNAQKSAVERFSNLLRSYKSIKIVTLSWTQ